MGISRYTHGLSDACAEFWWQIYRERPYVHRPDGYQTVNPSPVGPWLFAKHLGFGLDGTSKSHWQGEVSPDSVLLAGQKGEIEGILVCSVDKEELTGHILAGYFRRDEHGGGIAISLLDEALEHFRELRLQKAIAAPHISKSLEVECPIHLALLEQGFAWEENWERSADDWRRKTIYSEPGYGVFLGGPLHDFHVRAEVRKKADELKGKGITICKYAAEEFSNVKRKDTRCEMGDIEGDVTFAALVDGLVVGWLWEVQTFEDEGRTIANVVPEVIPGYRNRGIGKVLFHLGIEEVVRQGAEYGWAATGVHNPARLIYRSVGYRYWYTSFNLMSKRLA